MDTTIASKAASVLGRLGRGKPKHFTEAELDKRRERMKTINLRRRQKANEAATN